MNGEGRCLKSQSFSKERVLVCSPNLLLSVVGALQG